MAVRNCRRDGLARLKEQEKDKSISEDEFYVGKDDLQKLTDKYVEQVEQIGAAKEQEILEI